MNKTNNHSELFRSPSADYRWHTIRHDIGTTYSHSPDYVKAIASKSSTEGEGGIVMNVPYDNGFVDNLDNFKDLNHIAEILNQHGLKYWIYDEQGYPSGTAGGRATVNNPEYEAQGLTLIKKEGCGIDPVTVNKDERLRRLYLAYAIDENGNVIDVPVTNDTVSFEGVNGKWSLYVFAIKEFFEGTNALANGYKGKGWLTRKYLNIMDKDAVAKFIDVAYKPYVKHFKYFDKITAIFTDEPSLLEGHNGASAPYAQLAWAPGFEELFIKMHGYSVDHKLHFMFEGMSDEARIVRTNYRQTVSKMVAENYFGQINDFCLKHGTQLGGHLLGEERLNASTLSGDVMLCYRNMGLPGADFLYLNCDFAYPPSSQGMSVKTASSVARMTDKKNATMVEICALDLDYRLPFTEEEQGIMWNALNFIYFFGGNHINSYVDINRMLENKVPAVDYFARLGYFSQNAEWDGEIALYNPMATFQSYTMACGVENPVEPEDINLSNRIAAKLWRSQLDLLKVDDVFLAEAVVKNGTLTNGHATFTSIILPRAEVMPLECLKKVVQFKKEGGRVYFVDGAPYLPDSLDDMDEFKALASEITPIKFEDAITAITSECAYDLKIKNASNTIYVSKYDLEGESAYWIYNSNHTDITCDISLNGDAKGFDIYDPITGSIEYIEGSDVCIPFNKLCAKILVVKK